MTVYRYLIYLFIFFFSLFPGRDTFYELSSRHYVERRERDNMRIPPGDYVGYVWSRVRYAYSRESVPKDPSAIVADSESEMNLRRLGSHSSSAAAMSADLAV